MKRLLIIAFGLMLAGAASAQSNLVQSAYDYLKNGKLDKALQSIEPAAVHPKTSVEAKTWLYRGNIYLTIAVTKEEKYKTLCANPLDSAYNSYQKSISIDPEFIAPAAMPNSAKLGLFFLGDQYFNVGAEYYNKQQWPEARNYFERTKKIKNTFGEKDSLATFYATQCALKMDDKETAMKYLKELISMDYQKPELYSMLGGLYKEQGDTTKMINTVRMGRKRFPNDLGLIITETNYFLGKGDLTSAQALLKVAVEKEPNNPVLHYTIGNNYDRLALDSSLSQNDRESMLAEAEKAYLKAIELDPKYFDAYYNVGAMFFNKGVEVFQYANDKIAPDDFEAYNKAKEQYMGHWSKAVPYLEKASELQPNDMSTLLALKNLYARLNMPEKLKEVSDRINALKG